MGIENKKPDSTTLSCPVRAIVKSPKRLALACVGVLSTGLGAVGAFVPGLPTTIFIIIAAACFAKSCPWLEEVLLRNRIFAPAMAIIDGTRPFTNRLRMIAAVAMWTFGGIGTNLLLCRTDAGYAAPSIVLASLAAGSICIALYKRRAPAVFETTILIQGMSCKKCVHHVRHALAEVSGIRTKQVTLGRAVVIHHGESDLNAALGAVRSAGFEPTVETAA